MPFGALRCLSALDHAIWRRIELFKEQSRVSDVVDGLGHLDRSPGRPWSGREPLGYLAWQKARLHCCNGCDLLATQYNAIDATQACKGRRV